MRKYGIRRARARVVRRIGTKRQVVKKALAQRWKKSVAKVCKRVISRQAETKIQTYSFGLQPQVLQTTTTSTAGNWEIVSPGDPVFLNIAQGQLNNQRIGNEVRTKKLLLEYVLHPNNYNVTTNPAMLPQEVIIYFFKIRGTTQNQFGLTELAKFYENGTSSSYPTGYLMDVNSRLNTDSFKYLTHRRYKLGKSVVGSAANLTAANYNSATNNDFKYNVIGKIDLTKYCPKSIKWPDGASSSTADYIHMIVQTIAADGSLQSNAILPISMFGKITYMYTDM